MRIVHQYYLLIAVLNSHVGIKLIKECSRMFPILEGDVAVNEFSINSRLFHCVSGCPVVKVSFIY